MLPRVGCNLVRRRRSETIVFKTRLNPSSSVPGVIHGIQPPASNYRVSELTTFLSHDAFVCLGVQFWPSNSKPHQQHRVRSVVRHSGHYSTKARFLATALHHQPKFNTRSHVGTAEWRSVAIPEIDLIIDAAAPFTSSRAQAPKPRSASQCTIAIG